MKKRNNTLANLDLSIPVSGIKLSDIDLSIPVSGIKLSDIDLDKAISDIKIFQKKGVNKNV